jgi:hypothetical protein
MLSDSEGFNSQQKYAIVTKVLDFVKKVPQISYTVNLKSKFNLTPNSGVNDMVNVINQMGGWSSFMNWFNSGGPKIK